MQRCVVVVGSVVTIVEQKVVQCRGNEVARVIVGIPGIAVHMLNVIHKHNSPEREDGGQ